MRLAAIQFRPPKGRPDEARARLLELVERAADAGASLVVTPEMSTTGYVFSDADELRPHAEARDGETARALGEVAARRGLHVVVGFAERDGDALYNSAMLVGPNGALLAVYRKNLLFELDERWATAGTERVVVSTELGTMAPGICMDLNDDGFVAFVERERPDIIPFCTNWLEQGFDILPYWRFRLHRWRGWFVAANTWGTDSNVGFSGRSAILAPGGRIAALAGVSGDAIIVADTEAGDDATT